MTRSRYCDAGHGHRLFEYQIGPPMIRVTDRE